MRGCAALARCRLRHHAVDSHVPPCCLWTPPRPSPAPDFCPLQVGFEPFAPAALFFRIALTAAALARPHSGGAAGGLSMLQCVLAVALAVAVWGLLLVTKLVLGYLLRLIATTYVQHYDDKRAAATRTASRALEARRRTMGGPALQAAAAGGSGGKKEE